MLCCGYTLLYTMGMERRMTKKEEVVSCVQRLAAAAPEKREVGVTTQELAEQLQMQRSNLSTLLNELVADGKMEKLPGRPVHYRPLMAGDTPRGETSCFKILDSCEGSLRPMIQMAKAAILYPDHSLNTLIEGPSGSGKTTFGYLMYQFACENKVLPMGAPFERFSCHYYDDQEEKAYSRLFGAGEALEKAKGGMLFLDNVEYLPVGCREHLLDLIENDDAVLRDIILVCSLQDKARASVKDAYTARFSARIELQPLQNWQLGERFALVQQFLINEAVRMKRTVRVNAELLHCLCLYRCENNVKQFKNDIRLGCANAYLRAFHADEKEELPLYLNDFPSGVQRGLLYYKTYRKQLEELIPQGYAYTFSADSIITLCMTGEGGAVQMKNYLEKNAGLNGIQVIPLSISDRKALLNEVNRLREEHEIRCVIGTYDPGLHGIPFISVVKLFETPADKLDMLLTIPESDHTPVNYEMIFSYLSSQMPALDIKKLRKSLPRALAKIKRISAEGLDQNQELGLFLHIACAIDRLQNGEAMPEKGNRQGIISRNKRLYNDLREILSGLEETFDIRFSDDELAYMIAMVKKL